MNTEQLNRIRIDTRFGPMVAIATDNGLSILEFDKPNRRELWLARLAHWFPGYCVVDEVSPVLADTEKWLADYFQGLFLQLVQPRLDLRGTAFELKVWYALMQIPLGETFSYHRLAVTIGIPTGARAVGGANRRNPVSLIVPCHRVIGQNNSLVGYGGGLDIKQALLLHEKNPFLLVKEKPNQ